MTKLNVEKITSMIKNISDEYNESEKKVNEIQERVLRDIIRKNEDSEFGKKYDFKSINSREEFMKRVPVNEYSDLKPFIEDSQFKNDILLKGPITYWAMTSGTSGTHKYIPHNNESLDLWGKGVLRSLSPFLLENKDIDLSKHKCIFIVGPAMVKSINTVPVGYISGIVPIISEPVQFFNLVPDSVNKISNYQEKMNELLKISLDNPIIAFAGISTFTMNFIKYVQENGYELLKDNPKYLERILPCLNDDKTINVRLLWPDLKLFVSCGVSIDYCKEKLTSLFPDIWITNFYAGTEGVYGASEKSMDESISLNFDFYYFEFRDINTKKVYSLNEVKTKVAYEMIITSSNGLYRYTNGDLIEFLSIDPPRIKVLGRSNLMINLGGEKLNESEINTGLKLTKEELGLSINDYCFFGWIDNNCFVNHCIILEKDDKKVNLQNVSLSLFENLKKIKVGYRRSSNGLFKKPHVIFLKKGAFRELEKDIANQKGVVGHSKIKHLYTLNDITKVIKKEWIVEYSEDLDILDKFN